MVCEIQRQRRVLLDQQHADAICFVDVAHDLEDLLDDQWRETERGLI